MTWIDIELALVALAAMLSPTTLSFSVLALVVSDRPLRSGFWFYAGALAATLGIGIAAAFVLDDVAAGEHDHGRRCVGVHELELHVERALDGQEQVDVDEEAADREEDLLHGVAAEDRGERCAGDDRREHQQHCECAEVRRQDAVQRNRRGVTGENLTPANTIAIGEPEDRIPPVRRGGRLHGLEDDGRDEVLP